MCLILKKFSEIASKKWLHLISCLTKEQKKQNQLSINPISLGDLSKAS